MLPTFLSDFLLETGGNAAQFLMNFRDLENPAQFFGMNFRSRQGEMLPKFSYEFSIETVGNAVQLFRVSFG